MIDLRLVQTCPSCPEQYDVYYQQQMVGYIRLRFGNLGVYYPDFSVHGHTIVYEFDWDDGYKGQFDSDKERKFHLDKAKEAIARAMDLERCLD